jgi:hypothetical protein
VRYIPKQDEYGRWAVQDTAQPFYHLFIQRYADEESAQSFADILNATERGAGWREKAKLWALHTEICRYAPPLAAGAPPLTRVVRR